MDLRRFADLYVSETQEHISLLQRSLIALEHDSDGTALSEAFRASHTIKGLSAAMGYTLVAELAHRLEDRLAGLREGRTVLDGDLVDELLRSADGLEAAVGTAVRTGPGEPVTEQGFTEPVRPWAEAPAGTAVIAHVELDAATPMKGVRAMLIMRALEGHDGLLASDPAEFAEDFDGSFRIFFGAGTDTTSAEARVRGAGDVASFRIEPVAGAGALDNVARAAATQPRQVRVDEARLSSVADALAELSILFGRLESAGASAREEVTDRMGSILGDLEHDMRALRMVPLRHVFERLPRVVRDAARAVGRDVELVSGGDDVELDRTIVDELFEPLVHLLRNAVDHGIENPEQRAAAGKAPRGTISVNAARERGTVSVTVADDGRGVDRARVAAKARAAGIHEGDDSPGDDDLLRLMSNPGFSTADDVTAVSGRGVGMDVVVNRVRALGGAVAMRTRAGEGTTFTLRLPVTLALAQALRVRVGGEDYAIPLTHVAEAVEIDNNVAGVISVRARPIRLVRLRSMLGVGDVPGHERAAVIAGFGDRRAALAVDELVGREQIIVRSFDAAAGMLPYFSGATLLADGRPALVLDPLSLI